MMGPMRKKWAAFLCTLLALALCACGEKRSEEHTSELQSHMEIEYDVL